jgi:outer membrane translocation and assembly module TamA
VSVGTGTDTSMPSSTDLFTPEEMPGVVDQPTFVVIQPFLEFTTVDRSVNDRTGGIYRVSVAQYRDQDLDRYSFVRWDVDLRHYLSFARDTRTIALRAVAASARPDPGQDVPFYLQPTLGGARSLRGYRTFRYRDRSAVLLQAEYRWRINEFVTGALFSDTGTVGGSLDELGRFERNYGVGIRAGNRMGSAFRIDFAFGGREGNRLLVRFDDVF